ncbi:MAG TPA: hypothetical protein ENJ63_02465 [Dissulfuribacter thermophilus]|uniref:Peptidase C14 caspase domain-containing protein n=1 Tax=Dissulfuribacter thermophilus TaxID=1156395 RepID=A0A7V2SVT8_9BACT|nr:hypothetical protein [Dissulfuribacter thermophilus]
MGFEMKEVKGLRGVKEIRVILGVLVAIVLGVGALAHGTESEKVFLRLDPGGHTAIIRSLFFFDHGKRLISASDDKTIRIWDVSDLRHPKLIRTIRGEMGRGLFGMVFAISLDPAERILAVGGYLYDHTKDLKLATAIRLHDLKSGKVLQVLKGHEDAVSSLAFSPDGKYLASGSGDNTVIIWKKEGNGYRLLKRLKGHEKSIYALSFSRERLATGSYDHTVRLYDVKNAFRLIKVLKDHEDEVRAVAFSPDGRRLVTGFYDKRILLYDRDGNLIREFSKKETRPAALSFSPDGRFLLAGSYPDEPPAACYLYEFPSGRVKAAFKGHKNSVFAVSATQRDGRLILATGGGEAMEILLWDEGGKILSRIESAGTSIFSAAISSDGKKVGFGFTTLGKKYGPLEFSFDLNVRKLEKISSEKGLLRAREKRGGLELSLNRSLSKEMGLFYPESLLEVKRGGEVISRVKRDPTDGYRHDCFGFLNDRLFISGGANGRVFVYNLRGEKAAELVGHEGEVWAVAVTPDGKWAVTGGDDQTVRIWYLGDIKEGKFKKLLPTLTLFPSKDGKEWVAWTPEGYFTGSSPSSLRLIGYHINQGFYKQAKWVSFSQLYDIYFRPDLVKLKLARPTIDLSQYTRVSKVKEALETSPPPEVQILSPKEGSRLKSEWAALRVKVKDKGGRIGDIRVYVNGKIAASEGIYRVAKAERIELAKTDTLYATKRGVRLIKRRRVYGPEEGERPKVGVITPKEYTPLKGEIEKTYRIPLAPGENTITVQAMNGENTILSGPATVKIWAKIPRIPSRLFVLALGVKRFKDPEFNLKYTLNDARAFLKEMKTRARGVYKEVVTRLLEDAGKEEVLSAFYAISRQMRPTDAFVFYAATHGEVTDDRYWLVTRDFSGELVEETSLTSDEIMELMKALPAQRQVMILDTCHAGAVDWTMLDLYQARLTAFSMGSGIHVLSGASSQEEAQEGYRGHGHFTYFVLKALEGAADANHDKKITVVEMAPYVKAKVEKVTGGTQRPIAVNYGRDVVMTGR